MNPLGEEIQTMTYLDNAARAMPIDPPVEAVVTGPLPFFANPGGPHEAGRAAREALEAARRDILLDLAAARGRLYFCSCATEAANLAIQGFARSQQRAGMRRNQVVISAVEHPCVHATAHSLTRSGFEVQVVGVDADGRMDADDLAARVEPGRIGLVALMAVNNETGTIQDVERLAHGVKARDPGASSSATRCRQSGRFPSRQLPQSTCFSFPATSSMRTPPERASGWATRWPSTRCSSAVVRNPDCGPGPRIPPRRDSPRCCGPVFAIGIRITFTSTACTTGSWRDWTPAASARRPRYRPGRPRPTSCRWFCRPVQPSWSRPYRITASTSPAARPAAVLGPNRRVSFRPSAVPGPRR